MVWEVWLSLLCFGYGWDSFTCTFPWSLFQSYFYPPGYEMYFLKKIRIEPRNSRQLHGFSSLWLDNSNTLHPCLRQITTLINFHPFNPKYCSQQQCPVWKNTTHQLFKNRKQTQKRHFYVYIYIFCPLQIICILSLAQQNNQEANVVFCLFCSVTATQLSHFTIKRVGFFAFCFRPKDLHWI